MTSLRYELHFKVYGNNFEVYKVDEKTIKGNLSEQYITDLSNNSFIKYWCYPNPKDEDGDKKEICDLLVLFKNYCIIFQIKDIKTYDNYERFEAKAITPGISQLNGAERKLFTLDRDIFIKHPDREKELFQKAKYNKIIRILIIMNEDLEHRKWIAENKFKETIHILDKLSFEKIITELDTITDFSRYFFDKEQFIQKCENISIFGSEIDLLASYLNSARSFSQFETVKSDQLILSIEGSWDEYIHSKAYHSKKEADKSSYFVDYLVRDYLLNLPDGEKFAKELFSLDRLERRAFSDKYFDFISKIDISQKNYVGKRIMPFNDTTFILFYVSSDCPDEITFYLMELLSNSYTIWNNYKNSITVVLTSSVNREFFSCLLEETKIYPKEFEVERMERAKELNWFTELNFTVETISEYPISP